MKRVKITVIRRASYADLIKKYEDPATAPCRTKVGSVYYSENAERPEGLCEIAWRETLYPFVKTLAEGGGDFYGVWMKNKHSAMVSCNDGFRPVSFLLEAQD
ncbi:MAG: TIGR04076 family protein [Clostridia bacterium]|nr:TIGR04076 family protein [Clostridia bacterium]